MSLPGGVSGTMRLNGRAAWRLVSSTRLRLGRVQLSLVLAVENEDARLSGSRWLS
jgi:hypothetical protein